MGFGPAGIKRFSPSANPLFEFEVHAYYYGKNAKRLIEFEPGQLPEQVAVNIQQAGNEYSIHLVYFGNPQDYNSINLHEILKEADLIE